MANNGKALLSKIREDLKAGYTGLTLLGHEDDRATLVLDSAEAMARYADMLRASMTRALKRNEKLQWIAVICLLLLFSVATILTVLAHVWHWGWPASLTTVPGLGVTAYWPLKMILRVRTENLIFAMLPDLLPRLPAKDILKIFDRLLPAQK